MPISSEMSLIWWKKTNKILKFNLKNDQRPEGFLHTITLLNMSNRGVPIPILISDIGQISAKKTQNKTTHTKKIRLLGVGDKINSHKFQDLFI